MPKKRRRRLFVDRQVQGSLVVRFICYWLLFLTTVGQLFFCSSFISVLRPEISFYISLVVMTNILLCPMVVYDLLRFTNRFAGPMYRLKGAMKQLADGNHVEPISLREGDFWQEYANDFNRVLRRLQNDATESVAEAAAEDSSTTHRRPKVVAV